MKNLIKRILVIGLISVSIASSSFAQCNLTPKETADRLVQYRVSQIKGQSIESVSNDINECVEFHQQNANSSDTDSLIFASQIGEVFAQVTQEASNKSGNY